MQVPFLWRSSTDSFSLRPSPHMKFDFYDFLIVKIPVLDCLDAGINSVEVTSFVSPLWVPQMADHEIVAKSLPKVSQAKFIVRWTPINNHPLIEISTSFDTEKVLHLSWLLWSWIVQDILAFPGWHQLFDVTGFFFAVFVPYQCLFYMTDHPHRFYDTLRGQYNDDLLQLMGFDQKRVDVAVCCSGNSPQHAWL